MSSCLGKQMCIFCGEKWIDAVKIIMLVILDIIGIPHVAGGGVTLVIPGMSLSQNLGYEHKV